MCLLAIALDKKPTLEILRKAWNTNDDGAGIAWVPKDSRKVEYIKGIKSVAELHEIIQATPLPFVFHLRLASIGGIHEMLTQPFEISKESELNVHNQCDKVLFHNGTETFWDRYFDAAGLDIPVRPNSTTPQPMSDTRGIAMILSNHKTYKFMKHLLGKFVIVGYKSDKDTHPFRSYGDFTEEDGILYSNTHWKWKASNIYQGGHQVWKDTADWKSDDDYCGCGSLGADHSKKPALDKKKSI